MSAIEQPAARSGRITCWCGAARMSALSAMKWTPQKMMNSASWCWLMRLRELPRVAGVVGELDHLVALVVVAEDDEALAERGPRRRDPASPSPRRTGRGSASGSDCRSPMCSFSNCVRTSTVPMGFMPAGKRLRNALTADWTTWSRPAPPSRPPGCRGCRARAGSRPALGIRRRIVAVVMISGVSDPAMW